METILLAVMIAVLFAAVYFAAARLDRFVHKNNRIYRKPPYFSRSADDSGKKRKIDRCCFPHRRSSI